MPSYEDPESYWDSVIESEERYRAVGNRGLPDSFNKARKENLIPRLKQIGEEHVGGFSGKKILDAGCGTGIYSEFYDNQGSELFGVDISEEAITDIQKRNISGEFQQSTLADLPFDSNQFDVTHCFSALYHIVNDEAWKESLNELVRVTKTNGKLIFRTDWREKNKRIANHVKHRTKNQYLSVLARENRCKLEGVYSFRDMPKYQVLFDLFSGIWPVRNLFAKMILKTNKWTVNPNQRILVFSK